MQLLSYVIIQINEDREKYYFLNNKKKYTRSSPFYMPHFNTKYYVIKNKIKFKQLQTCNTVIILRNQFLYLYITQRCTSS